MMPAQQNLIMYFNSQFFNLTSSIIFFQQSTL